MSANITELADRLEKLAKAATQGPWHETGRIVWTLEPACCGRGSENGCCGEPEAVQEEVCTASEEDAAYIAAANPQAMLALIAEIKRLKEKANEQD